MIILELLVVIFFVIFFLAIYCAGITCIWYTFISLKKGEIIVNDKLYKIKKNPIMYLIGIGIGFFLSYIFFVIPTIALYQEFLIKNN